MTDQEALLAAVRAAPDDDTPRLVYADFLDDTGEPADAARAEFIRVQVELARVHGSLDPDCPRRNQRSDRCGSYIEPKTLKPVPCVDCWRPLGDKLGRLFWDTPTPAWILAEPLAPRLRSWDLKTGAVRCVIPGGGELIYRRGFVDEVRIGLREFVGGPCSCATTRHPESGAVGHAACAGTGATTGLAGELFRGHPITTVIPSDREPNDYGPPADDYRYGWLSEVEHGAGPAGLPRAILKALADTCTGDGILRWRTREGAIKALSAALVAFGRAAALPLPQ